MKVTEEARRKRFYKSANIAPIDEAAASYRVELDGRPLRTPGRRVLALPTPGLAEALAAEWDAQGEFIEPLSMPLTRLVNSAIDGVVGREAEVRASMLAYGGSDLICYHAEEPAELVERQMRRWGEIHTWARREHGIDLALTTGIMPVVQRPDMLARIDTSFGDRTALELAGLHTITTLTGSVMLALALALGRLDAEQAWSLAHIDEDFQIEKWGQDWEAAERRQTRWRDMQAACRLLKST